MLKLMQLLWILLTAVSILIVENSFQYNQMTDLKIDATAFN